MTMWLSAVYASYQDQVHARMRGTMVAIQFLATSLMGLRVGPYLVGLISDAAGDLRVAMLSFLVFMPVAVALLLYASRSLSSEVDNI